MAKDFLSKAADFGKDLMKGLIDKTKKAKNEKLPDRELDKYRGELENLKENIRKMTIDQVTTRLRDAFMVDLKELKITDDATKSLYWEQAFREAYIEIKNIKEHVKEVARRPLDQLVAASTHARLKEIIGAKDPEKEGKNFFDEIVEKIPGGKKGLAAGLSLLSFLGIKKDSNLGKFIDWIKEKFGIEDEDEKKKDDKKEAATGEAEGAKADKEKKGPTLSTEAKEVLSKFKDAHITLATDNLNADYRSLVAETGGSKEKAFKSIEKGLKENSNYRKIHTAINAVVKEKQFKHRLIDIQLNDLSNIEAGKIAKAIENKKDDADPKKIRSFLDSIRKEPKKVAQLTSKFEKLA